MIATPVAPHCHVELDRDAVVDGLIDAVILGSELPGVDVEIVEATHTAACEALDRLVDLAHRAIDLGPAQRLQAVLDELVRAGRYHAGTARHLTALAAALGVMAPA